MLIKKLKEKFQKKNKNSIKNFYIDDLETTELSSNEEKYIQSKKNIDCKSSIEFNLINLNFENLEEKNIRKLSNENYIKNFKTEMCKNYQIKGFCEFGDTCTFAHGDKELRNKIIENEQYKTKNCYSFEKGYCPYGYRCQYIHNNNFKSILNNLLYQINSYLYENKKENFVELITNEFKLNTKRLSIFKKITK